MSLLASEIAAHISIVTYPGFEQDKPLWFPIKTNDNFSVSSSDWFPLCLVNLWRNLYIYIYNVSGGIS